MSMGWLHGVLIMCRHFGPLWPMHIGANCLNFLGGPSPPLFAPMPMHTHSWFKLLPQFVRHQRALPVLYIL